jgi:protein phosphatase
MICAERGEAQEKGAFGVPEGEIRFAAKSDRGRVRSSNQDRVHAAPAPREKLATHGHLFAVADGMGGHAAGDVASELALRTLVDFYYGADLAVGEDPGRLLQEGFQLANRAILAEGERDAAMHKMGTTCTAAVVRGGRLSVVHVGDSRAYLLHGQELYLLTRDHNLAEELLNEGRIEPAEAASHNGQHILTRALGTEETARPEQSEPHSLQTGDRVLICSDGLIRVVSDQEIVETLTERSVTAATTALVERANAQGGPDNISVVLVEVL